MNEPLLILQLQQGDRQAYTQLVQAYQHMIYNTVLGIVQQAQEAEDVAQEVFVQAYLNIQGFRGDSKLSTWLYRIAISKALDWERKSRAKKRVNLVKSVFGIGTKEEDTVVEFHHPGVQMENKEQAAMLFSAIKHLPENQRIAFVLIKVEGMSYDEASAVLQTTVKAVEALMHRAKENLRKTLTKYYSNHS